MRTRTNVMFLTVCAVLGCGSKQAADFSRFHGIYRIDSHTFNASACDAEGNAVSGSDPLLVLFSMFAMNVGNFAVAESCSDVAACRGRAKNPVPMVMTAADFDASFSTVASDGQGLTGTSFGLETSGQVAHVDENVLVRTDEEIRIEMRQYVLSCEINGGKCDENATIAAASSTPCKALRVVVATFQEGL